MYAALYLPRLSLQAVLTDLSLGAGASALPLAVVEGNAKKPVVLEMTDRAAREGVVAGLSIPQAMARCAGLVARHRSPQAEASLEGILFHAAYSLSPRVESEPGGLALVDLSGVALGGIEARCRELRGELAATGLDLRVGIAESCALAVMAARRSDGVSFVEGPASRQAFLDTLPIGAAGPSAEVSGILEKWGIRSVGGFAALERPAVAARLGAEGLALWDSVNGRDRRLIGVTPIPPRFEESWDFEYEVDSLEPVLFILRRFLGQLCLKLRIAHQVAARVEVELGLAYGEPLRAAQNLPEPNCDAEALFRMMMGQLERLEAGSPVARLSLRIEAADFKERQLGLFESNVRNPLRFAQTLSRVAGIVGAENLGRPAVEPGGRPDGFVLEGMPGSLESRECLSLSEHYGMPLRRYRPMRAARVKLDGRDPERIDAGEIRGGVKASRGPWLHSGHWWESGRSWGRSEWDVELEGGGLYRLVNEAGNWFLEGEYD